MSVFHDGIAGPVLHIYGVSVGALWPIHPALQ
jgi:hypothetical protein